MRSPSPSSLVTLLGICMILLATADSRADLVAHYALDELPGSGMTALDSFGTNHGSIIGTGPVTQGATAADPSLGTSTTFSKTSGIDLGTSNTVRPVDQFTMTWWMRPDTLNAFDRIYESLNGTTNSGNGIRIDLGGNGNKLRVLLRDGGGSNTQHNHSLPLNNAGNWYFVAVRYDSTLGDGSALRLTVLEHAANIDAATITAATQSPGSLGTGPINLHGNGAFLAASNGDATGGDNFGGGLDDFAIFQTGDDFGVLSDADLATIATSGALPFDPPLPRPTINTFSASSSSISSGTPITLSWDVTGSDSLTILPTIGNVNDQSTDGAGSIEITPNASTVYELTCGNSAGSVTAKLQVTVDGLQINPIISEFLASNNGSLLDGDGADSDWIEIHNPGLSAFDLSGYHLTDDFSIPTAWTFPDGTMIPGEGYLVVFASNQAVSDYVDAQGNLHTNFALRASGEYLALLSPGGSAVLTGFFPAYPAQEPDISYSLEGFLLSPSPGSPATAPGVLGFVADTTFDVDRGFYDTPFSVNISTTTTDADIYYTTDGTIPSPANGTLHGPPIPITSTTTLRAIATKSGFASTNVDTQTYVFLEDVLEQPNNPDGYPDEWEGYPADYEMDPEVVDHPSYAADMVAAMKAFPSLSLVLDKDDMFGPQGIYQHPRSQGENWERPVSAELIVPDASEPGFQLDAGIRIQGGSSRNPDTPKHSLSLRFRKDYGAGKLDYPLFADQPDGGNAVNKFDFLQLRCGYNFGWIHRHYFQARHAQYNRDQWVNDLYLAMGQAGSHGRWVHLYINGIYWGLYHMHERPDSDFMASYFGGDDTDYDALNVNDAKEGDKAAWNTMFGIAAGNIASPVEYANIQQYLDVDSLIDYMLVNFYVGNRDWDGHNWRAARKREPGAGYKFFPWDSEFAISPNNAGGNSSPKPLSEALVTNVTTRNGSGRPSGLHQTLTGNAEYVMRFADRAHQHLFNDGPLGPATAADIWTTRSNRMDDAIIAESARWGDFKYDVSPGLGAGGNFERYTRNDHYLPDQTWILGTYIPQRSTILLDQLKNRNLYPDTDAPVFSQHGGSVPIGFSLSMTNPTGIGTLYYTLDGSDPRDPDAGGTLVSSSAQTYSAAVTLNASVTVRSRILNGSEWSALNSAAFLAGPLATGATLAVSEIMYNPAGPLEDTEFIELVNISPSTTIELGGSRFTVGIDFVFPPNTLLGPGERILVVADSSAFAGAYGGSSNVAGDFAGSLDNDGERLVLLDATDNVILDFTYNDAGNWPSEADQSGHSLVLRAPALGSDLNDPLAWRDSTTPGGNPGHSDGVSLSGDPHADNDGDGLSSLLEHGIGTSDSTADARAAQLMPNLDPDGHFSVTFHLNLLADDITSQLEQSGDFKTWIPATGFETSSVIRHATNGTASITLRSIAPISNSSQLFLRQRITRP